MIDAMKNIIRSLERRGLIEETDDRVDEVCNQYDLLWKETLDQKQLAVIELIEKLDEILADEAANENEKVKAKNIKKLLAASIEMKPGSAKEITAHVTLVTPKGHAPACVRIVDSIPVSVETITTTVETTVETTYEDDESEGEDDNTAITPMDLKTSMRNYSRDELLSLVGELYPRESAIEQDANAKIKKQSMENHFALIKLLGKDIESSADDALEAIDQIKMLDYPDELSNMKKYDMFMGIQKWIVLDEEAEPNEKLLAQYLSYLIERTSIV